MSVTEQPLSTLRTNPRNVATDDVDRRLNKCPYCEEQERDGYKWRHNDGDVVCDTCHTVFSEHNPPSIPDKATERRTARLHGRTRSTRCQVPTYDKSNRVRLAGGFTHAYIADDGEDRQYTLNNYDEITDGLWVPLK